MKQLTILAIIMCSVFTSVNVQKKKKQDQEAIKKMCGCYEVSFNFAETFEYSKDTSYIPSKVKHDRGLEWVELVEDSKNKIMLQHLLIVGKPTKPTVIKHWRQDWLFENQDLYSYNGNNTWKYLQLPKDAVKGQWTQKVYQVDDSPRYEGSSTWLHIDGKSFWENTSDAPLPRREYTKRSDYNITVRTNKHEIVANGWVHDQDNEKVIRTSDKEDVLLAEEKGVNNYVKVNDERCQAAQDWWKNNQQTWSIVRDKWTEILARNKNLTLKDKVQEKPLYRHLFAKSFSKEKKDIDMIVDAFVVD